jgi:hypothetical protein
MDLDLRRRFFAEEIQACGNVRTEAPEYQHLAFYSSAEDDEQQIADWLAGRADFGNGETPEAEVVPLPVPGDEQAG